MSDVEITFTLTRRQVEIVRDALSVYKNSSAPTLDDLAEAERVENVLRTPWLEEKASHGITVTNAEWDERMAQASLDRIARIKQGNGT